MFSAGYVYKPSLFVIEMEQEQSMAPDHRKNDEAGVRMRSRVCR